MIEPALADLREEICKRSRADDWVAALLGWTQLRAGWCCAQGLAEQGARYEELVSGAAEAAQARGGAKASPRKWELRR